MSVLRMEPAFVIAQVERTGMQGLLFFRKKMRSGLAQSIRGIPVTCFELLAEKALCDAVKHERQCFQTPRTEHS